MKHNPFVPREQRTAILTFDNGQLVRAESLFLAPTNLYGTPTLSVASFAISTKRSRVLYTS